MRDEQTGSWWQQVSGEAIQGPLKGKHLNAVFWDELSFATWKREQPNGRVLLPDERVKAKYEAANWEEEYEKLRAITPINPADPLKPRALVVGIEVNGASKAYPVEALQKQQLILDEVGGIPLFLAISEDQKSVRAFERKLNGRTLEFFINHRASRVVSMTFTPNNASLFNKEKVEADGRRVVEQMIADELDRIKFVDAESGSVWDFQGKALRGTLAGRQLKPISVLKDYWFDWKFYHPKTAVYLLGEQ